MPFPIELNFVVDNLYNNTAIPIHLRTGATVLVGPNGSGKTQVLKTLKQALAPHAAGRKIRYLGANRLTTIDHFRANVQGAAGTYDLQSAIVASASNLPSRHLAESAVGDFLTLSNRADIQIKVRERLRALFNREINFTWENAGLKINMVSSSGIGYPGVAEASGLLNLIALLAALYDDEVSILLIDEPEISLHPQLQTFYYQEIQKVAGDPATPGKKLVVLSTHSTEFISIRRPEQICNVVFFQDNLKPPIQLLPTTPELQNRKLKALLVRLGLHQKLAFFSRTPLLVEGPSDETICLALESKMSIYLGAAGCQIVPVTGKGQIPTVSKLFRVINKAPVILTDIDSLADGLDLINSLVYSIESETAAHGMGAPGVVALATGVYNDFCQKVQQEWGAIATEAEQSSIWAQRDITKDPVIYKRRAGMATILHANDAYFQQNQAKAAWKPIRDRLKALLGLLESAGCFILAKGYIEHYYQFVQAANGLDKPEWAVEEAIGIEDSTNNQQIENGYSDILRALRFAARVPSIDESKYLADTILSTVTPIVNRLSPKFTSEQATMLAKDILGDRASIFEFSVIPQNETAQLQVNMSSIILEVEGLPLQFGTNSNPIEIVRQNIRRKSS